MQFTVVDFYFVSIETFISCLLMMNICLHSHLILQQCFADTFICLYCCSLQTHHVDSTLKRRGNSRFHVVSTCNPRGVFIGLFVSWAEALLSSLLKTLLSSVFRCCSLLLPCVLLVIVSSFNFLLKLFILN